MDNTHSTPNVHASAPPAIRVEHLSKRYGTIQALNNVSLTVEHGQICCILGPNGAGKTTLLKLMTTVTRPDTGQVWIEGQDALHHPLVVRQAIGVVAQENRFDKYLSVWHNLVLHARLHGFQRPQYEARITELLTKVNLLDRKDSLLEELSGGMQRRISLIRALLHKPRVLFLDEPTTGLDPQARLEIWRTIQDLKDTTVVLTTHYLEEAERLSHHIVMLNHGQLVLSGSARTLKQAISPTQTYDILLMHPVAGSYVDRLQTILPPSSPPIGISAVDQLTFQLVDPTVLSTVVAAIDPADFKHLRVAEADLEDVFMAIAQGTYRPQQPGVHL